MSVNKKIQPNQFSRLAVYTQHIYVCLVLLYRYSPTVMFRGTPHILLYSYPTVVIVMAAHQKASITLVNFVEASSFSDI